MLRGSGDYRIERWLAGRTPLVTVLSSLARGPLPAMVVYHSFAGKKTDDLLGFAIPLADAGCLAVLPAKSTGSAPTGSRRRWPGSEGFFERFQVSL